MFHHKYAFIQNTGVSNYSPQSKGGNDRDREEELNSWFRNLTTGLKTGREF